VVFETTPHEKAPHTTGLGSRARRPIGYRPRIDSDPVVSKVDPLGDVLINALPGMFGLPIVPGLTWPVVDPGGLAPWTEFDNPDALPVEFDNPDALPIEEAPPADPAAVPRGPPACASTIELESASAPTNAIVASFMIVSLVVVRR
jgi:hypothetical protein